LPPQSKRRAHLDIAINRPAAPARGAGFQTCRIADFQVGKALEITRFAGFETRDTADLEVCATKSSRAPACGNCTTMGGDHAQSHQSTAMEHSRPGPDFRATHIKSSGQRSVDLHLFGPVADEIEICHDDISTYSL
jgi:hypothetical protein